MNKIISYFKDKREIKRELKVDRKLKALLIGINYRNTSGELRGCINDVRQIEKLLRKCGYTEFMILTEDDVMKPTRENILKGFDWLVEDSENYNKVFLHYSGHGSWLRDITSDEVDQKDECLVPLDFSPEGMIIDDEIKTVLLDKIKCPLFGLIDACHSGSIFDLPNNYYADRRLTQTHAVVQQNDITMISGCRDEQTSADAWLNKKHQGALTFFFCKSYKFNINLEKLLTNILKGLQRKGFTQRPVFSSSKEIRLRNRLRLF